MKRAFTSVGFVLAAGGLCLSVVLSQLANMRAVLSGQMDILGQPGYAVECCLEAVSGPLCLSILPVAAALPFTSAFAEDLESRFCRSCLLRSSTVSYVRGKILAAAVSGGAAAVAGLLLALLISRVVYLPAETIQKGVSQEAVSAAQYLLVEWVMKLLAFFLAGGLWALVGVLAAAVTESRYMAWTLPFVSYYLLLILTTRYFPSLYALNPDEWLNPGTQWPADGSGAWLIMTGAAAILALVSGSIMRRRLADV